MKVTLLNYQPDALDILLYTKDTRLQGAQSLEDIKAWPMEKKLEHLAYMRDTIQSSWEFASYVFEINDVTRAFTHQLVRTRTASYAQESQRTVDVRNNGYRVPDFNKQCDKNFYQQSIENSLGDYTLLIDKGIPVQDARGVLPTNMYTNIIVGANLRTLHGMAETRLCTRTQGEYQEVFKLMKTEVIKVHPWAGDFIQVYCANHGTCCFPRYKDCPIQQYTISQNHQNLAKIAVKHNLAKITHEAVPVAKDGRTML